MSVVRAPFVTRVRRVGCTALAAASVAFIGVTSAQAQKETKIPRRPKLEAGADTNDPMALYRHGVAIIAKRPDEAADAFYWATRLAPRWADPYYGRRVALLLTRRGELPQYLAGHRGLLERQDVQEIDSLQYQALMRDPWLQPRLDRYLVQELFYQVTRSFEGYGAPTGDPRVDAWMASTLGKYADAVRLYGAALRRYPKQHELHAGRARAFHALLQYDSAAAELTQLVEKMRKSEERRLVFLFDSKVIFEYALGALAVLREDPDGARAAFGRALAEDLSMYMAHASLADLALRQGDTATAVAEYDLAVQLRPDDGALRFGYATALIRAGRGQEAAGQLEKAIELEPYFAQPYFLLARLYDTSGMPDEAVQQYQRFLARAPRAMAEYAWVAQRVAALTSAK